MNANAVDFAEFHRSHHAFKFSVRTRLSSHKAVIALGSPSKEVRRDIFPHTASDAAAILYIESSGDVRRMWR